jgi:3-mercaptopyruvate sulfurtransferase SseA
VAIPAHPEYYTTLDQAKALLKQPDGALVSVRTWDEFVGNTWATATSSPGGHSRGQMGSWRGGCQQHERLPQPGRHHEARPRDPRHVG